MAMVCNVVGQEPTGVVVGVAVTEGVLMGVPVGGTVVFVGVIVKGGGVVVSVFVAVAKGGVVCVAVGVVVCTPLIASLKKVQATLSPAAAVMATLF